MEDIQIIETQERTNEGDFKNENLDSSSDEDNEEDSKHPNWAEHLAQVESSENSNYRSSLTSLKQTLKRNLDYYSKNPICSMETLYMYPHGSRKSFCTAAEENNSGAAGNDQEPKPNPSSSTFIHELNFTLEANNPCKHYLDLSSSILTIFDKIQEKYFKIMDIMSERAQIEGCEIEGDTSISFSLIETWKFIIEETLRLIGPQVGKIQLTQVRNSLSACKSRFGQMQKAGKDLLRILRLSKKKITALEFISSKICADVLESFEHKLKYEIPEESSEDSPKKSKILDRSSDSDLEIRLGFDGICLQFNDHWIKLSQCIPEHRLFFLDLFSTQLGQFSEDIEIQLTACQILIQQSGDKGEECPHQVDSLLSELFEILNITNLTYSLLPKEKKLILTAASKLVNEIAVAEKRVANLVQNTVILENSVKYLHSRRNGLMKNKFSMSQLFTEKNLTLILQTSVEKSIALNLKIIFDSYKHLRLDVFRSITAVSSSLSSFFTITPSQELKDDESASQVLQPMAVGSVRAFEYGNVFQEYLEASTRLHQTGMIDSSMIELCSDPVVLFLRKSEDLANLYADNIPQLENILWVLNTGQHEALGGILVWANLIVKPLILTQLELVPYWRLKVLSLIREFAKDSSRIISLLEEFSQFIRTREDECLALVKDLSRSGEDLMIEVLTTDVKQKPKNSSTYKMFNKNMKDTTSSDVRISLTSSDYTLILLQPMQQCKRINFSESCAPMQFEIIKLAVDAIFLERLQEVKRLMLKMNKDVHLLKSLNGILDYKKWKELHTLEKNIIIHGLALMQKSFVRQRRRINQVRNVLDDFGNIVTFIQYVTRVKFEEESGRQEFFENLDEPGLTTFRTVMENLNSFRIVDYAPSNRVGQWIEDLILDSESKFGTNQLGALPYEVIPYDFRPRTGFTASFYNYGRKENSCDFVSPIPEPEKNPEDDEWLHPMEMLQEYRPSDLAIPNQSILGQPISLPVVSEDPCQYLKRISTEFSRALTVPTLSVLQILINPIPPRLPEPVGFLQSVCFLMSHIYAKLNLKKLSNEHEEIRKQCFVLLRICDKMDITRLVNNNFVKRRICGLLSDMESENHRRLERLHLLSTHEMVGYLKARCGIMNDEEAQAHAIAKIKNAVNNPQGEFEIFYKTEELALKIHTGEIYSFADLGPSEQKSLLAEMIRIGENTLGQANRILENARSSLEQAFQYLLEIENFTRPAANPEENKFRPEEIFILIRTLQEQLKIWDQYCQIFENLLICSKTNIQKLLKNRKQGKSVGLFPICPFVDNPFILQLNSTWTPSSDMAPFQFAIPEQNFGESVTSVSTTLENLVANIIHPRRSLSLLRTPISTGNSNLQQFSQFASAFKKEIESLSSWNISNFNRLRTIFLGTSAGSVEFSGLSGLEILIGHAFLEIKTFSSLSDECVEDLHSSLKELMNEANSFEKSTIPLLRKFSKKNAKSILKIEASLRFIAPAALPSGDSEEFDPKKELKPQREEEISKSELNLLLSGKTKRSTSTSKSREENWIMILRDSKIHLRKKNKPDKSFGELSRETQAHVTSRLMDTTCQVFLQMTKSIVQKNIRKDTKKFDSSVVSLISGLTNFMSTRNKRLSTEQQLQLYNSFEILSRSVRVVGAVIESIENESHKICQRLQYLKLYKTLSLNAVASPPIPIIQSGRGIEKVTRSRKRQLEEYIQKLHTFPIFVRLPTINL